MKNIFNEIGRYFRGYNGQGGSGKRDISIKRRNAVSIKLKEADDFFDVQRRYYLIGSILEKICDAISNTPVWITDNDGRKDTSRKSLKFVKKINSTCRNSVLSNSFLRDLAFQYILYGVAYVCKKQYNALGDEFFVLDNRDIAQVKYKSSLPYGYDIDSLSYHVRRRGGGFDDTLESVEIKGKDVYPIFSKPVSNTDCSYSSENFNNSPLYMIKEELEAYANLIDVLGESYGNGGARKIISFKNTNDDLAFNLPLQKNKDELKSELRENYGRNSGDDMYIITQQDVNVGNLSSAVSEFDAYNVMQKLESAISNAFHYPISLLGLKNGAYKSQTESEKDFYIHCVSPIANRLFKHLDYVFGTGIYENGGKIELDYTELDFFQESKQKKGAAIQTFMQGATQAVALKAMTSEEVRNEIINIL